MPVTTSDPLASVAALPGVAEAVDAAVDQILPGSLWSADTVRATRLINTIDGKTIELR